MPSYIKKFSEISANDVPLVGGKNASLGEMFSTLATAQICVPDGFALTTTAFRDFITFNKIGDAINAALETLDKQNFSNLREVGRQCRALMMSGELPPEIKQQAIAAYSVLCSGKDDAVAVRSSATAEDLATASFAGQHESFLNVHGENGLLLAIHKCFASLYTDRAIKYREDNGFRHKDVTLSVGVQKMVRSDNGVSGVGFTLEPESGFRNIVHISGVWGLGENMVQGTVTPDEFYVFKPSLEKGCNAVIQHKLGAKELTMRYALGSPDCTTINIETDEEQRAKFVLSDAEITRLAKWFVAIEKHYEKPMDIEWAKDGTTGELFILQARPETVHSQRNTTMIKEYSITAKGKCIASGNAIGSGVVTGIARLLDSPKDADELKEGEILVTSMTSPDWDPVLKKSAAIITDKGGRTSHASIVARELGIPAVVGCGHASYAIKTGDLVTVSCCEGKTGFVYEGKAGIEERVIDCSATETTKVKPMLITGDPDTAFMHSFYPVSGVGLLRMEFMITHAIRIHPMALVHLNEIQDTAVRATIEKATSGYADKKQFFIDKLSEGIATVAAAFYPREVIVRMSDFKTNEYAGLIGGKAFEPSEENPMLGFRGASRYYHEMYREGFDMECSAIARVRKEMGLTNVKLMIPFCRTVEEGKKVIGVLRANGLDRNEDPSLEIYLMTEIPSNILLAEDFARDFDGFSIGSNDLTQLVLGVDRDSSIVSTLFDEQNKAVTQLIALVIDKAKKAGRKIGICGQAPGDLDDYVQFLVAHGINTISFTPDALFRGISRIYKAEEAKSSMQMVVANEPVK